MAKNNKTVGVKFRSPSFRHKGAKYISAEVESRAEKGDQEALGLIATLVSKKSGVVEVFKVEQKTPKAPKAPKAPDGEEGGVRQ